MKTAKLLIPTLLLAITVKAQQKPAAKAKQPAAKVQPAAPAVLQLPTPEFYLHFVLPLDSTAAPAGYGLSPDQLIPVGGYVEDMSDQKKINFQLGRFFKSYQWADGSRLEFISRSSSMINSVNVEKFKVTKTGGKDTIALYVDMYKSAPVHVPNGFKYFTREQLAGEFVPVLTELKAFFLKPDKYGEPETKKEGFQLLSYLQANVGLEYLMDNDVLAPLLNDVGIDLDLRAYLIRSYVFHKFYCEATGQGDSKRLAFNAMVDDYKVVIAKHDFMLKGHLAEVMVKRDR